MRLLQSEAPCQAAEAAHEKRIQFRPGESDTFAGAQDLHDPVRSSRSNDSEVAELIDHFTVNLAERVDELQDAETKGELGRLGALSNVLAVNALELGFELLAASATDLEACSVANDVEATRETLIDLTDIAKRIRMTHRGSV